MTSICGCAGAFWSLGRSSGGRSRCGGRKFPDKHEGRVFLVSRAMKFAVTALLRDANRPKVFGMDDAGCSGREISIEISIAPGDGGANCLGSVALAVKLRGKHPADFWAVEWGFDVPFVIGESQLSGKVPCGLLLDYPIAEAEQGPMAKIAQELSQDSSVDR